MYTNAAEFPVSEQEGRIVQNYKLTATQVSFTCGYLIFDLQLTT